MQCRRCAKPQMVEIRMTVADTDLRFVRCVRCEAQHWFAPDGEVPLRAVLDLARITR